MDLEQTLTAHVGRSVEVYSDNTFVQGTLLGIGNGLLSVDAVSSSYASSSGPVSIRIASVSFIRVLAA